MRDTRAIADDDLVSQCKKGSLKHQEILYKRFYGYAMGISLRYSFNRNDAMEAVNDAFIKVFKNIDSYQADKTFKAWLRTVIINTTIDRRRKDMKHQLNIELEATMPLPAAEYIIAELSAAEILAMLQMLPPVHRAVFNLYEIDGYDHDEIAGMLGIPASSSRVYLSRAKEKLRTLIKKENSTV